MAMTIRSVCLLAAVLVAGCDERRRLAGDTDGPGPLGMGTGGSDGGLGGAGTDGGRPITPGSGGVTATSGAAGAVVSPGSGGAAAAPGSGGAAATPGSGGGTAPPGTGGVGVTPVRPLPVGARQAVLQATRFLWQTTPDASLLAMADAGAFRTTEDLRKLALQLLIDSRAAAGVGDFYRWWLDLAFVKNRVKDPAVFPQFTPDMASDMAAETQTFGTRVTLDGDGLFSTLLTAPYSYVNQRLAIVYGLPSIDGTELRRMALDPAIRAGIFTQPAILSMSPGTRASPTVRGVFINRQMLCRSFVPPAGAVTAPPPPPDPAVKMTYRQLLERETSSAPVCTGCHVIMDGIGFALENFDGIGQFRSTDNTLPVDASGRLAGLPSGDVVFNGPVELGQVLARTPEAQACMTTKWLEYAVGRALTDAPADATAQREAHALFVASGLNLRALIAGVVQTELFLTHAPICTPGLNQTCNESPLISSTRGVCNQGGRCECTSGSPSPSSGLCP